MGGFQALWARPPLVDGISCERSPRRFAEVARDWRMGRPASVIGFRALLVATGGRALRDGGQHPPSWSWPSPLWPSARREADRSAPLVINRELLRPEFVSVRPGDPPRPDLSQPPHPIVQSDTRGRLDLRGGNGGSDVGRRSPRAAS